MLTSFSLQFLKPAYTSVSSIFLSFLVFCTHSFIPSTSIPPEADGLVFMMPLIVIQF